MNTRSWVQFPSGLPSSKRNVSMPAIKIENITWGGYSENIKLPVEAIIEVQESHYDEGSIQSIIHDVLEGYTNVPVESFDLHVVMKSGPVLKYRKQREDTLTFSGPLW